MDRQKKAMIIGTVITAALIICSVTLFVAKNQASWQTRLKDSLPTWTPTPEHPYSAAYQEKFSYLLSNLSMREDWNDAVGDEVIAFINTGYSAKASDPNATTQDVTMDDVAGMGLSTLAMSVFAERIRCDGPIQPPVLKKLIAVVSSKLASEKYIDRMYGITVLTNIGYMTEPAFANQVRSMASDPNPEVAALAKRQLQFEKDPAYREYWTRIRKAKGY